LLYLLIFYTIIYILFVQFSDFLLQFL